MAETVNLSDF